MLSCSPLKLDFRLQSDENKGEYGYFTSERGFLDKKLKICILSGYYPGTRFNSSVNHRLYAKKFGYYYIFDNTPRFDKRTYMRKLEALIEYINLFDWIFWIDDDAYFTDFNIPIENFIDNEFNFIVCKSPSSKKIFTKISSGQFLIKNTDKAKKFLEAGLMIDLEEVKKWWSKEFGLFTKGDQDVMVYLMETNPDFSNFFYKILDHNMFNNREYEYREKIDEHFLVHFTGKNKKIDKSNFCTRLQCNEYISPADMLYELSLR